MGRKNGFTSLELILNLALIAPIFGGFLLLLRQSTRSLIQTKSVYQAEIEIETALSFIRASMANMDTHRFAIPPIIHQHGKIVLADGTQNPICNSQSQLSPDKHSDAVTTVVLEPTKTLRVLRLEKVANNISVLACFRAKTAQSSLSLQEAKSFLGISTSHFFELQLVRQSQTGNPECRELTMTYEQGMLFSQRDVSPDFIQLLVPIKELYTLYVDQNSQLRLLAHLGQSNIENQPLVAGIRQIRASLSKNPDRELYNLSVSLAHLRRPDRIVQYSHRLARLPVWNLLFNHGVLE